MRNFSAIAIVLLIACAAPGASAATLSTVYSDFGPGNSFNLTTGWGISGTSTSNGYRAQAERFTPAFSASLNSIEMALGRNQGSGNTNVSLVEDNGGFPTGAVLESWLNIPAGGTFGSSYPPRLINSVAQPTLVAGTTYWVRAEPSDSTSVSVWNNNSTGVADRFGYAFSPGAWDALGPPAPNGGAFRITGTNVPEPAAFAMTLVAGAVWLSRRRNRSGNC